MSLGDELTKQCARVFASAWRERNSETVPDETKITFANDGVNIDAAVLYADLSASTQLVDEKTKGFAAEIYKTFLYSAARIIRAENGVITAYDGDRVMAVFPGHARTAAVRAALKINFAVKFIIQPQMKAVYAESDYVVKHTCGIDWSSMMVAKTGVRGANDLVWVGRAANYAAKLCELPNVSATWITEEVYDFMLDEVKFVSPPKQDVWTPCLWEKTGRRVYTSDAWWYFS